MGCVFGFTAVNTRTTEEKNNVWKLMDPSDPTLPARLKTFMHLSRPLDLNFGVGLAYTTK
jgi:hypothetical protein